MPDTTVTLRVHAGTTSWSEQTTQDGAHRILDGLRDPNGVITLTRAPVTGTVHIPVRSITGVEVTGELAAADG
jgi:hypothetical protein